MERHAGCRLATKESKNINEIPNHRLRDASPISDNPFQSILRAYSNKLPRSSQEMHQTRTKGLHPLPKLAKWDPLKPIQALDSWIYTTSIASTYLIWRDEVEHLASDAIEIWSLLSFTFVMLGSFLVSRLTPFFYSCELASPICDVPQWTTQHWSVKRSISFNNHRDDVHRSYLLQNTSREKLDERRRNVRMISY